jgi:hypothetical protein
VYSLSTQSRRASWAAIPAWQDRTCLAPDTTRSRHRFFSEQIYFAMSKIHGFSVLYGGFECERPEVFRKHCTRKVNAFEVRDQLAYLG